MRTVAAAAIVVLMTGVAFAKDFVIDPKECFISGSWSAYQVGGVYCPKSEIADLSVTSEFDAWTKRNRVMSRLRKGETVVVPERYILKVPSTVLDMSRSGGKMIGEP